MQNEGIVGDLEVWKQTCEAEYIYKCFPLFDGGLDQNGFRVNIHVLLPKEDFIAWDLDKFFEKDGVPEIIPINKKCMYLACKELIETDE